jgi:hypothetical protein
MAIFKPGSIISDIRGSVSGRVYSIGKSGAVISKRTYRNRQIGTRQNRVRSNFAICQQAWKSLSDGQKTDWNSQADQVVQKNRLGQDYDESGFNLFCRLNYQRLNAGLAIFTSAPGLAPSMQFPSFNFIFDTDTNEFRIEILSSWPSDFAYIIEASPLCSPGITYARDKVQSIALIEEADGSVINLSDAYANVYGLSIADMPDDAFFWLSIRALHIPTGYTSGRIFFSTDFEFIFDTDAEQIISRMNEVGSQLSFEQELAINFFVLNLKGLGDFGSTNIWNELEYLRVGSMNDASHALVEWIMRSGYGANDATLVGMPSFVNGQGYQGGTAVAVSEGFIPNAAPSGVFSQNNALVGVYEFGGALDEYSFGIIDSNLSIFYINSIISSSGSLNSSGAADSPFASIPAFYFIRRNNSSDCQGFVDGIQNNNYVTSSAGLSGFNLYTSSANDSGNATSSPSSIIGLVYAGSDFSMSFTQFINSYNQFMSDFNA